jgi:hypothetical protein
MIYEISEILEKIGKDLNYKVSPNDVVIIDLENFSKLRYDEIQSFVNAYGYDRLQDDLENANRNNKHLFPAIANLTSVFPWYKIKKEFAISYANTLTEHSNLSNSILNLAIETVGKKKFLEEIKEYTINLVVRLNSSIYNLKLPDDAIIKDIDSIGTLETYTLKKIIEICGIDKILRDVKLDIEIIFNLFKVYPRLKIPKEIVLSKIDFTTTTDKELIKKFVEDYGYDKTIRDLNYDNALNIIKMMQIFPYFKVPLDKTVNEINLNAVMEYDMPRFVEVFNGLDGIVKIKKIIGIKRFLRNYPELKNKLNLPSDKKELENKIRNDWDEKTDTTMGHYLGATKNHITKNIKYPYSHIIDTELQKLGNK